MTITIALATLGCKVNQSESESWQALLRQKGYQIVDFTEKASLYIINTCTVTHQADRKSRQMIRRARRLNPQALIVVTGCYAQTNPTAVQKIKGVNLIIGTSEKARLPALVEELIQQKLTASLFVRSYQPEEKFTELPTEKKLIRTRAYLKIQEGCQQYCTYCIIPYARGPLRSRSLANTLEEARGLIKAGFQEIVLLGIHLGAYQGENTGEDLAFLLKKLLALDPQVRWRLGSLEPGEVTPALLELMSAPNFCPHLHLPLQSGHDALLKAMHRPYNTKQYRETISKIRKKLPDIAITTDVMVGFPGETANHFAESLAFITEMAFSRLHVFQYSPRRGTPAATFPQQVPTLQRESRSQQLQALGQKLEKQYMAGFLGRNVEVLVEQQISETIWEGRSANYLKVRFAAEVPLKKVVIRLEKIAENYCWGKLIPEGGV